MAGCDAHHDPNDPGDDEASRKRITRYAVAAAVVGALLAAIAASGGPITWVAALAAVAGAVGGGALGFFLGSAYDWFNRLKVQDPRDITIFAQVKCAGRNPFGFQPFSDGDWACNMGVRELKVLSPTTLTQTVGRSLVEEIWWRAAPDSGIPRAYSTYNDKQIATSVPIFHCEISALAGNFSVAGGAIGSAVGAGVGAAAAAAACVSLGFLSAAICALVIAAAAAVGAIAGGTTGSLAGALVGWLGDELKEIEPFEGTGWVVKPGDWMYLTGRWVTDLSHEHNEIHDIERIVLVRPPAAKPAEPVVHGAAITGIGRRAAPTGDGLHLH